MADKIKGLTIEISADTTKVSQSLSEANKEIRTTAKQLKEVESLLKLDPDNVELISQKTSLLARQTEASKNKLALLNKQLDEMKASGVDQTSDGFLKLQRQVIKTNNAIKKNTDELGNKNVKAQKKSQKTTKVSTKSFTDMAAKAAIVVGAIVGVTKKLIDFAVEGAKSSNLNQTAFDDFANSLEALDEASEHARNSIGSLLAPALTEIANTAVGALNDITEAVENGAGLEDVITSLTSSIGDVATDILGKLPDFLYNLITSLSSILPELVPQLVKGIVEVLPAVIDGLIDSLPNIIQALVDGIFTLFDSLFEAEAKTSFNLFGDLFGKTGLNLGIALVNGIIAGLNNLAEFTIPALTLFGQKLWDDVHVKLFEIPKIPMLAKGGLLSSGSAIVGEAGAELLQMTPSGAMVQPLTSNTTNNYYSSNSGGDITINFTGSLSQLARILQPEIVKENNRLGTNLLS